MRGEVGAWLAGVASLALVLGFTAGFGGLLYTKEQNDLFCVACHLHEEKFVRSRARPSATDLAGAHHASRQAVRCIGCHGGADGVRGLQIRALAAFDTLRFLTGRYEEPRRMRLAVRDAACRQCHEPIVRVTREQEEAQEGRGDSYHAITEHRTVKTTCAACHTSHTPGQKRLQFIDRPTALPICRACHEHMGEDVSG